MGKKVKQAYRLQRKKKPGERVHYTEKEIIRAIKKANGFLTLAAKSLNVTYKCVWERKNKSKKIQRVLDAIRQQRLDFAESKLIENVGDKKEQSIFYILNNLGGKRGYRQRSEIGLHNLKGKSFKIKVEREEKLNKLSVEELKVLEGLLVKIHGEKA